MRGRTSITCRDVIPLEDSITPTQDSPNSYFITFTISQHKISIKIPKLVARLITQKHVCGNKKTKPKKLLIRRKVFSIFSNVFGNKNSSAHSHGFCGSESEMRPKVFGFIRGKSNKTKHNAHIRCRCDKGACVANGNVSTGVKVIGTRESAGKLIKVSSKVVLTQRRWRWIKVRSLRKAFGKEGSKLKHIRAQGERESLELCKKRILMGRKCNPLNTSGTLQYDKNVILIPEELP